MIREDRLARQDCGAAAHFRLVGTGAGINQTLDKRDVLISSFNQEYASDPTRYIYYQVGWVYLAMKGTEANYVDEFVREHLNRESLYLSITPPQAASVRAVEQSVCLVIKERDLQILAYQSPSILQSIAATLALRLRSYL